MILEIGVLYAWALGLLSAGHMAEPQQTGGTPHVAAVVQMGFGPPRTIEETFPRRDNRDPAWWISSGARFIVERDGTARTLLGELPPSDSWRVRYAKASPRLTETGRYPQHIFRLVSNASGTSPVTEQVYFMATAERRPKGSDTSGSICLMLQYTSENDTYYGCLGRDSRATIKRKRAGQYETLAEVRMRELPAPGTKSAWTGASFRTEPAGAGALLTLARDDGAGWYTLAEAYDAAPLPSVGQAGLRSDLMDLRFRGYELRFRGARATSSATASSVSS